MGDAGVNHLGYFTGVWGRGGTSIASHGFTGALHIWRRTPEGDLCPDRAVGGHYGAIVDACWAADGASLLTVSCDQTARITALITGEQSQWCEIARPQVHGHDFSCVAAIPPRDGGGSQIYRYTSGSEEKVLRVFEAPRAFHDTLAMAKGDTALGPRTPAITTAYGATLPALGLSNKAFNYEDGDAAGADALPEGMDPMFSSGGPDVAPACAPSAVAGPPLEEHLSQNTLWPEIHKLYGHGNEVHCVAADPHGEFLASASRAQSASTAGIIVWDTATWTARAVLEAHTLTVTQLAFSPCGRYLASCSRDRTVAVFTRTDAPAQPFVLSSHAKAHSRIVWGLGWSSDSQLLATAARDGAVKVWSVGEHGRLGGTPLCTVALGDSVRSVAFAPSMPADGAYLVAAGLEGGEVVLASLRWPLGADAAEWTQLWRTSCFEQHAAAVRRLCWRIEAGAEESVLELASCSDDHGIRIFRVERA